MPDVTIKVLGDQDTEVTAQRMDAAAGKVTTIREDVLVAVNVARTVCGRSTYPNIGVIVAELPRPLDHRSENCAGIQVWVDTNKALDARIILRELEIEIINSWAADPEFLDLFGSVEIVVDTDRVCGLRVSNEDSGGLNTERWDDHDDA